MTNEELAVRIQEGDRDKLEELWNQVAGLVKWKANRFLNALEGAATVEYEDLVNTGWLAMTAALETYSPREGSFNTWLGFYLQTAFSEATGWRTEKQKQDPLRHAQSFSQPYFHKDGSEVELGDMIEDPADQTELLEDQIFRQELRQTISLLLEEIPEKYREVLERRYLRGMSFRDISRELGKSEWELRQLERTGIYKLKAPQYIRHLKPFVDFDYYSYNGLGAFRSTGMSVQERYLMRKEHR